MAASIKDVAARASVSVGTVSNVLNQRPGVSGAVLERVQAAITELGYVRNDAARQLRAGQSRSVGLVLPDIGNPFFAEVARGAERRAVEEDMAVLIVTGSGDAARETRLLELLLEQRVRGVLFSPASDDVSAAQRIVDAGTPVVLVDRDSGCTALPSVAVDDVAGGRLATNHLVGMGRRRITFVGGMRASRQVADRLAGAHEAVDDEPQVQLDIIERTGMTVGDGRDAAEQLLARSPEYQPDAIFAANDLLAVGVLQGLLAANRRVPEDVAVIGYDDIAFASAAVVPLSSVRQPADELGYTAVDILLSPASVQRSTRVRFQPELIMRRSTAAT